MNNYIVVIGGSNIDITGFPNSNLVMEDSNPGKIKISFGGVGRNISENLAKLNIPTKLITVFGDDFYSEKLINHCVSNKIDVSNSLFKKNCSTSIYLVILNEKGNMQLALSDMNSINYLTPSFLKTKSEIINEAKYIVVDTNLPKDTLEYIAYNYTNIPKILDPVSTNKAQKVKSFIGKFDIIKPNLIESEYLTDINYSSEKDLTKIAQVLLNKGVKEIFITYGDKGVFYCNNSKQVFLKNPTIKAINTTGAGDAFTSGIIYGKYNGYSLDRIAKFASATAIITISHEHTIHPQLNEDLLSKEMEDLKWI